MIPILFRADATAFLSNGVGRLTDAITCEVTEERNGEYSLYMVYPITGLHYDEIKHSAIIVAKPNRAQERQAFRIYKISRPINGKVGVYANHISYDLNQIPVTPFNATGIANALNGIITNSAEPNPFTFTTTLTNTDTYFNTTKPKSARAVLGGSEESILQAFSGSASPEYKWDNYNVQLLANRGANNGVTLRYGKNITDIKQEENIAETITAVLPFWVDSETDIALWGDIQRSPYSSNYPHSRTATLDLTGEFESTPTREELNAYAYNYVQTKGIPNVNINVSFIDLSQTEEYKNVAILESVNLCDEVAIIFEKLGIRTTAKVIKTIWDVLAGRYVSIQVGNPKSSLASTLTATIQEVNNTSNRMVNVDVRIDKSEGKISSVVAQVEGLQTNITSLEQTSDGLKLEIEEVTRVQTEDGEVINNVKRTFDFDAEAGLTIKRSNSPTSTIYGDDGLVVYYEDEPVAELGYRRVNCNNGLGVQDWAIEQGQNGSALNFYRKG